MGVYLSNLNYSFSGSTYAQKQDESNPGKELNTKAQDKLQENTPLDKDKVDLAPERTGNSRLEQKEYSNKEKIDLERLKAADREVKAHEQAHRSVGGQYVRGGINYRYETGPDGQRYAVGGDVDIDASKIQGDPEATADKMAQIKRAALAPADPSPQDRKVAALATRMEAAARQEAAKKAQEEKVSEENQKQQEQKETDDNVRKVSSGNLGVSPYEAVNEFKKGINPELVSNLFDLFT